ncbi:hypothetical protein PTTG_30012, partial [Puccinia triticina 1-1 BBBD Race 1]
WKPLQQACLKFDALYNRIANNTESGTSPDDWMLNARGMYQEQVHKHFTANQAWILLKDIPKFKKLSGKAKNGIHQAKHKVTKDEYKQKKMKLLESLEKQSAKRTLEAKCANEEATRANNIQEEWVALDQEKNEMTLMFQDQSLRASNERTSRPSTSENEGTSSPPTSENDGNSRPPTSEKDSNDDESEEEEDNLRDGPDEPVAGTCYPLAGTRQRVAAATTTGMTGEAFLPVKEVL